MINCFYSLVTTIFVVLLKFSYSNAEYDNYCNAGLCPYSEKHVACGNDGVSWKISKQSFLNIF